MFIGITAERRERCTHVILCSNICWIFGSIKTLKADYKQRSNNKMQASKL